MAGKKVAAKKKTCSRKKETKTMKTVKKGEKSSPPTTTKPKLKIPKGTKGVALISVYDKTGIVEFAKALIDMGWFILSSGGTANKLREAGLKVTDVADLVGGAAILGHRVVTLSREIHAGLLARCITADMAEMKKLGLPMIGLVCCDFYPLEKAIDSPVATIDSVVEMTDIGGPTMVRSAAKGRRIVICNVADRGWVISKLQESGDLTDDDYQYLRAKAEFTVAKYCLDSAIYHGGQELYLGLTASKAQELAYAENRCQNPAHLFKDGSDDPFAMHRFEIMAGDPSYISFADGNNILEIICTLAETFRRIDGKVPFLVIAGKHGNPCGAAFDWEDPGVAIKKALLGDGTAIMGGEVITNFKINAHLGQLLYATGDYQVRVGRDKWGLDIILAPDFDDETVELMGNKAKRRLLKNPALKDPQPSTQKWIYKPVRGGVLTQKAYPFYLSFNGIQEWVGQPMNKKKFQDLILAWAICWKASSNTIALAKDGQLIALGCGQQDRIACVRLCLERAARAGHDTQGSVFASDAFFPFAISKQPDYIIENFIGRIRNLSEVLERSKDPAKQKLKKLGKIALDIAAFDNREGTELLADAGCYGGIVPGDGNKLDEVKLFFRFVGMKVAILPPEIRGFAKH